MECERSLFLPIFLFYVVDYVDSVAADGECELLGLVGLEGDSCGLALPGGGRAFGVGEVVCVGFTEGFAEDGLAATELGDDGEELLAVVGDAAVGDVVPVPTGR